MRKQVNSPHVRSDCTISDDGDRYDDISEYDDTCKHTRKVSFDKVRRGNRENEPIAVGTLNPRGINEEPREKKAGSSDAATQKEHLAVVRSKRG